MDYDAEVLGGGGGGGGYAGYGAGGGGGGHRRRWLPCPRAIDRAGHADGCP